jgi:hypothetical protein
MARFVWLAVLTAVLVSGCGAGDNSLMPDCEARLLWNGTLYEGIQIDEPRPLGGRLGEAVIPRCGPVPKRSVQVRDITGVHPSIAVNAARDASLVWLGPGYLLASPAHPLHEATRAAVGRWDATEGYRCDEPRTVRGRAEERPTAVSGYVRVSVDDAALDVFLARRDIDRIVNLDRRTIVKGLMRHGVPYVEAGDEFDLTVRKCVGRESEESVAGLERIVATKLTA